MQTKFRGNKIFSELENEKATSDMKFSIEDRTSTCLDFPVVLDCLKSNCITVLGKDKVGDHYFETVPEIINTYQMVEEMTFQLSYLPLRSSMNIWPVIKAVEINSSPEREELANFAEIIEDVKLLRQYFKENIKSLSLFQDLANELELPIELLEMFENAFEEENNLSGKKFPSIGKLRQQIESLKTRVIHMIQSIIRSPNMKEKIADSSFIEIEGRYCILLFNTYKRGVGIVHSTSNTGRTVFVEPFEVCYS